MPRKSTASSSQYTGRLRRVRGRALPQGRAQEDSAFFGPGAYINKLVGAYLNTAEYKEGVPNDYLCRVADMDSMEEGGLRRHRDPVVPRAQNKCFDLTGRYDEEWFNEDYALIKDATDDGDKAWKKWKNDYTKHLCVNICPYIGSGKRACAFSQECGGHSVPEPKKRNMMQWHVLCIAIGAPLRRPPACPAPRPAPPARPPARPTARPPDRPTARPQRSPSASRRSCAFPRRSRTRWACCSPG